MDLNNEQKKAVSVKAGPAVVLAGPGSGKTAVITRRTIKLIREEGIPSGNILVVTFTRAAAEEMKRRLLKEAENEEEKQVTFGTFHSIFFKILRFAYNLDGSCVIRESDAVRELSRLAFELGLRIESTDLIPEILGEIGKVKGSGLGPKEYAPATVDAESFWKMYTGYADILRKNRLVDFEDMMLMAEALFDTRPDVLDIWREKFRYIMIDEFQDINPLQYKLIRLIASPSDNLFIVGDDDQAIYGFRGSDPKIMLGFEKDYPGAEKIILNKNYRCKESIVRVAENLIRRNVDRFEKRIEAVNRGGAAPDVRVFKDNKEECDEIAKIMREYAGEGVPWSQMAVIYRTNRQTGRMAAVLDASNVPFSFKGSFQCIYSHFAVKDVLSYIKVALGDRKRETVLGIINRPKRYISRDMFASEEYSFGELRIKAQGKSWLTEALDKLEYDLSYIKRGTPASAVIYIRRGVGYDLFLKEYAEAKGIRPEELYEILDIFEEEAEGFRDFNEWFDYLAKMKNELERRQDIEKNEAREAVTITTMHGSKGLEYDVVFIPDANEGITPYQKAMTPEDLEQERRMFYVAMTRAAKKLHVFSVMRLNGKVLPVSRFVKEMLDFS